jgi:hypothetical protein
VDYPQPLVRPRIQIEGLVTLPMFAFFRLLGFIAYPVIKEERNLNWRLKPVNAIGIVGFAITASVVVGFLY